jgi:hypothetical protein
VATGEDVEEGDDSSLRLRWPSRFQASPLPGEHTVKEACWKVLAGMVTTEDDIKQGKEGLPIREITKRIESSGLRTLRGGSTNEGSVAGALSRDQLFFHVAPGTYALHVRTCETLLPDSISPCYRHLICFGSACEASFASCGRGLPGLPGLIRQASTSMAADSRSVAITAA